MGNEKVGVFGLHLVISGLFLNIVSCRAELIIPRLSRDRASKFGEQTIIGAVLVIPILIAINSLIYTFALGITSSNILPLMTALHTSAFVIFLVFNAHNINTGNTREVFLSYSLQGAIYLCLVYIIYLSGMQNLELYMTAHIASFTIYPISRFIFSTKTKPLTQSNCFCFSEVLQEKKNVLPLIMQGMINSSSVALLYFGVNIAGGQAAVGIFTIAHKLLSFPLRAISLPARQVLILAFNNNLIKRRSLAMTAAGACSVIVALKIALLNFDTSELSSRSALIVGNVEDMFLWWGGALIALPAIGAAISRGDGKQYSIFETFVLLSRAFCIFIVIVFSVSTTFFMEATSFIYFLMALTFLITTLVRMEEKCR